MIRRDNFLLIPSALMTDNLPTDDQWESMANHLFAMQRSIYWWIGDFVIQGEQQMGDDIYQYIDPSFSLSLIERCVAVARAFPVSQRNPNLSWTHHQSVMSLPPQIQRTALRKAEMEQWDSGQFKKYLQELRSA